MNLQEWERKASAAVRAALEFSYRERALALGHGFSLWYVPHSLRIVVAVDAPNDEFRHVLTLSPAWGNVTARIHAMDVLRKLPTWPVTAI